MENEGNVSEDSSPKQVKNNKAAFLPFSKSFFFFYGKQDCKYINQ
jgi:hypothetical protein